ncbi:hypothetical protein M5U04_03360 [Xenorhabdus sp. XENO-1]|nr:hypothetical protein [Xenorhabdus bovienii]MCP9267160.1 hypothetical protein [Xenorhabdus bovienii subsp. africana]
MSEQQVGFFIIKRQQHIELTAVEMATVIDIGLYFGSAVTLRPVSNCQPADSWTVTGVIPCTLCRKGLVEGTNLG